MKHLSSEPSTRVATMTELVGIAHTIEIEAVRCYSRLADEMRRRGENDTAVAFDTMGREEFEHVAAVERWADGLGETVPQDDRFRWRLPVDLAASWNEVVGSALLTPYRAYAIAVDNEQRAFAFYAYLSAATDDPAIAREAEVLAREELRHAAVLRTLRRAAWRHERRGSTGSEGEPEPAETAAQLAGQIAAAEVAIAACHRQLAERLRHLGDLQSATLIEGLAGEAAERTGAAIPERCETEACRAEQPAALLLAAQRPLEQLCEVLETALLVAPDRDMQSIAQDALAGAVSRIARLGRRIEAVLSQRQPQG